METNQEIKAIGVMSGTSLDGVDLVACGFTPNQKSWDYKIYHGITIPYHHEIFDNLLRSHKLNGYELAMLHVQYGHYLGKAIKQFSESNNFIPDFIASHGYTVFHEPNKQFTFQIGSGAEIAAITGITTVCDFRTTDVALGGNGAPLVPIGDELLFGEYEACLNLGGFCNISFNQDGQRLAFDICPVNIVINSLMRKLGKPYDEGGKEAQKGTVDKKLLTALDQIDFYRIHPPKSLGREFTDQYIFPLFENSLPVQDLLATFYEHVTNQISRIINSLPDGKVLITGGGAYNKFLIELLKQKCSMELVIPENKLVDLKEALVFAFLGMLRLKEKTNCLKSVTGSSRDNIGGAVYIS